MSAGFRVTQFSFLTCFLSHSVSLFIWQKWKSKCGMFIQGKINAAFWHKNEYIMWEAKAKEKIKFLNCLQPIDKTLKQAAWHSSVSLPDNYSIIVATRQGSCEWGCECPLIFLFSKFGSILWKCRLKNKQTKNNFIFSSC